MTTSPGPSPSTGLRHDPNEHVMPRPSTNAKKAIALRASDERRQCRGQRFSIENL
jgi:hypothetical protein